MHPDELPAVFVTHAADILGDTAQDVSGSQIVKVTAAQAVDCDINLAHRPTPSPHWARTSAPRCSRASLYLRPPSVKR
jgi:hypothetical protein